MPLIKVIAKLKKRMGMQYWMIKCPHCGKKHWFKAGAYTKDPTDSLGPHGTPCGKEVEIESKCRVCGCTDSKACPGGCYWVKPNLCSRCANKE